MSVLFVKLLHPLDHRRIHAAVLCTLGVKRGLPHAVRTAKLRNANTSFWLLQGRQDLTLGVKGLLHAGSPSNRYIGRLYF